MGAPPPAKQIEAVKRRPTRLSKLSLALAAPHPLLWTATLAITAADGLWLASLGISLEPLGFALVAGAVAALIAAGAFWTLVKPEPSLRAMALSTACLLGFTTAVAVLHYLAATLDRPLVDRPLAAVEAALAFDWQSHVAFLESHPLVSRGLALAYHSSGVQVAVVVITLSALRRLRRLWRFVHLFAITLFVVIAVSALFPAEGPYAFYMGVKSGTSAFETIGATWHLDAVSRLRSGEASSLAFTEMRGLATFPSFHVCLALITAWALAPIRFIGPAAVLLNGIVVVATIGAGGHYLPDVLAGGILGGLAIAYPAFRASRHMRRRNPYPSRSQQETAVAHSAAMAPAVVRSRSMMRPG